MKPSKRMNKRRGLSPTVWTASKKSWEYLPPSYQPKLAQTLTACFQEWGQQRSKGTLSCLDPLSSTLQFLGQLHGHGPNILSYTQGLISRKPAICTSEPPPSNDLRSKPRAASEASALRSLVASGNSKTEQKQTGLCSMARGEEKGT